MDQDIIFASNDYVLVNKRANEHIDGDFPHTVSKSVAEQYGSLLPAGKHWPWLCHQLDMPTSGCLLLALNKRAASRAGREFSQRRVGKVYLAVCEGVLGEPRQSFTWSWPIGEDETDPLQFRMCVPPSSGEGGKLEEGASNPEVSQPPCQENAKIGVEASSPENASRTLEAGDSLHSYHNSRTLTPGKTFRPALTTGTVISLGRYVSDSPRCKQVDSGQETADSESKPCVHDPSSRPVSLVVLQPHTGRRHQLRVHLARAGHPNVNDVIYNPHYLGMRGKLPLDGDSPRGARAADPPTFAAATKDSRSSENTTNELPRLYLHAWLLSIPRLFTDGQMPSLVYAADTEAFLDGVELDLEPEKLRAALQGIESTFSAEMREIQ